MKFCIQVLFLSLLCNSVQADSLERVELSQKFIMKIKKILERAVAQTESKTLEEEDNLEAYLLMIGSLTLLSKRGKFEKRPSYYKMLGLTFFNFPSKFRDPFFAESLKIFKKASNMQKISERGKLLIRAAYSAWSLGLNDEAQELLDECKEHGCKLTQIEKGMIRKMRNLQYF